MLKKIKGKNVVVLYSNCQKAKKAVKKLKIKTIAQYTKYHRKDKLLPMHPHVVYAKKGWRDWYDFFSKERPNFYKKYKEAKAAVKRLRIATRPSYRKLKSKNPRLPSHPDEYYRGKGWSGWGSFLYTKKKK
ncbi:integrase repeat-containing protein [Thermoproteota archaeon]